VYRITFVSGLFHGAKDRPESEKVLCLLLETLVKIDEMYLRMHPEAPPIYQAGVRYQTEPLGQEDWCDIPTVMKQGWGDCEDLAAWRCAELRVRYGIPARATFTWRVLPNKVTLYHILVKHPDGRIEDPSRKLGMKKQHLTGQVWVRNEDQWRNLAACAAGGACASSGAGWSEGFPAWLYERGT
jgi:hypothetical protein